MLRRIIQNQVFISFCCEYIAIHTVSQNCYEVPETLLDWKSAQKFLTPKESVQ